MVIIDGQSTSDWQPAATQHYFRDRERNDDEEQRMLIMRKAFQMFDTQKTGFIETIKISTILNTMGQLFDEGELQDLIEEEDPENTGRVNFDGFANIASNFLQEEEDAEAMQQELKEAFRLYDREGNGYITTSTPQELAALAVLVAVAGDTFEALQMFALAAEATGSRQGSSHILNRERAVVALAVNSIVARDIRCVYTSVPATLKEILAALDDKLSNEDLDGIITEIDTDGSGTVDFDEFMEMMTGE
ncbi:troponin C [Anopheles darlingi]|uniref:Troponin C n=1 Tax=Anopheles darlingi TaxID=43151 RepID=W5JAB9_ANODA|nr:troponin C [Anopheles darlingi]